MSFATSSYRVFEKLGTGERWWAAEFAIRACGLLLLGVAALAVWWLYRSVHTPPPHEARGAELLAALAIVAGGCGGGMLTAVGPALFEQVPIPGGGAMLGLWAEGSHGEARGGFPPDAQFPLRPAAASPPRATASGPGQIPPISHGDKRDE